MKFCKNCLYPDTKQDLWFNEEGICAACLAHDDRLEIDWKEREKEFLEIIKKYKTKDYYDCVVPVSGGKDSTYQAIKVRNLGLKPLCVCAETCSFTEIGQRNLDNMKNNGFDVITISTSKEVRSKLNRAGLEIVGDISWPEHVSIFTVPVTAAVNYNIPLIIWGENPQNEYGGPATNQKNNVLDRNWLEEFGGLIGLRVDDLVGHEGLTEKDLSMFFYPTDKDLKRVGVTGLFLGYYFPWEGYNNKLIAQSYGFESYGRVVEGHYVDYENLDNYQAGLHEYFMYLKFGYGRATAQASIDIRRGRVTREIAAKAVKELEGKYPHTFLGRELKSILNEIGLSIEDFEKYCDQFTNYSIFETNSDGGLKHDKYGNLIRKYDP